MSRLRIACPWTCFAVSLVWIARANAQPTEPNQLVNPLTPAADCQNCHSFGNAEIHAEDPLYAPFFGWQGSMMGNSAKDPVFWAGVAIASQDDPDTTIECVRCHAPRAFLEGRGDAIAMDELQPDDLAGVECELCHRMVEDAGVPAGNAGYTLDDVLVNGDIPRRGPWAYEEGDPGQPAHEWINDPFTGSSRLCGTCHDVTTPRERLDDDGVGLGIQFSEQRTYSEWLGSEFAVAGEDFRSCQDCHMPAVTDMPGCFDNVNAGLSHPEGGRRHDLVGANRFMLELLRGIYGSEGTDEIADFFWDTSIERTDELLATAATLEVEAPSDVDLGAGLEGIVATVTNNTGHKLPTGYSEGRVMWIEVVASYDDNVVWSSGEWNGTEFDADDPQLHTYRAVAEELATGTTLHLLLNDHWVEDTRLPPRGLQPNIETDPVGDRYTLLGNGTWPNTDTAQYAFAGRDDVFDATPAVTDDDVLDVRVRLLYLVNSREYVQFLADANQTNTAGDDVLGLFEDAGFAQPVELAAADLAIPITAFGGVADTSSSSGASVDTSSGGSPTDPDTGPEPTTTGGSGESTIGEVDDEGGGGGCSCRTATPSMPWLLRLRTRFSPSSAEPQAEHELAPHPIEAVHPALVVGDARQGGEAGRVLVRRRDELAIEILEQPALLQPVAEVAGLRVVGAGVVVVERPITRARERERGRHVLRADCLLQRRQPPVGETDDLAVALARLLEQGCEPLVEPRRTFGEVRGDVRMHDLVHERAATGADVHHEGIVGRRVVAVGRGRHVVEQLLRPREVRRVGAEEPDVDDALGIAGEELRPQSLHRPAHGVHRMALDLARVLVADHHERRLD
jgi:hypothetical protein